MCDHAQIPMCDHAQIADSGHAGSGSTTVRPEEAAAMDLRTACTVLGLKPESSLDEAKNVVDA